MVATPFVKDALMNLQALALATVAVPVEFGTWPKVVSFCRYKRSRRLSAKLDMDGNPERKCYLTTMFDWFDWFDWISLKRFRAAATFSLYSAGSSP